jgi:hypothetical protein
VSKEPFDDWYDDRPWLKPRDRSEILANAAAVFFCVGCIMTLAWGVVLAALAVAMWLVLGASVDMDRLANASLALGFVSCVIALFVERRRP